MTRARIVPGQQASRVELRAETATVRRIERERLEASADAERLRTAARAEAAGILQDARARANDFVRAAAKEAAEKEQAKLAAIAIALRVREERAQDADLDRTVELARMLAERLVGESLRVDAQTTAKLARQALAEARGARIMRIDAHPEDIPALEQHLAALVGQVVALSPDPALEHGSLRLHTDLGTIDAQLRPQLERLAAALRDALR